MPNTKEKKIVPDPSPTGEVLYNPTTGEPISAGVTPTGAATGGTNQPYSVITGEGGTPSPSNPPANNPTPITTPSSGTAGGMSAKSYAQWLYSQSLSLASEQRKQLVDASEITRKRSIADANSSYMKSLATYGQNAEKIASMGLSGSGYGEYLTSQAYAQKRSTVQNANAQHLATEKEAIYQEKVAKQEALSTYHANMLQAQAEQNNAYNSLLSAASSGASIESIMASGQWGLLGADQQTQIKNMAQSNSFKLRIDGGESIEDIMADANYNTLSADAQQSLKNYYQTKQKNDANAAATAYTNFINLLSNRTPLASIQGMPYYDLMTQDQIAVFESIEAYNTANAQLLGGKPLDEIKADTELWSKLSTKDAAQLEIDAETIAQNKFDTASNYDKYVSGAISDILSGQRNLSQIMEDEYYKQGIQNGNLTEQDIKNIESAAKFREYYNKIDTDVESFVEFSKTDEFNNLDEEYKNELKENAKNAAFDKLEGMLEDKSIDEIESEHADLWALLGEDEKNELKETSKGISEDKIKQQQENHTTLLGLIEGGMSVDSIKKYYPNLYNDLGDVYKDDLASFDAANKIKDILDNSIGTTLDDIKKDNKDLWDKVAGTQYEKDIADYATGDASNEGFNSDAAYDELLKRWKSGNYTADVIRGQEIYKHLNKSDLDELEKTIAYDTNKKTVETRIANGDDWRTIVNSKEYKGLNADDLGAIDDSLNERAQKEHDRLSALIQSGDIKTQEQLEQAVNSNILFNTEDVETDKYIDSLIDELDKKIENDNKFAAAKDVDRMLNGEYSWADIENSNAYQDLDEETKDLAQEEYDKALDAALDEMIDDAISTGNLDYIKGNAWYDNLSDAQKGIIDQAINDYNLQHNIAVNEGKGALKLQISGNIADDAYASLNDLRNEAGFSSFSKKEQANFEDEWIRNYALRLNQSYSGDKSAEVAKLIAEGMNDGGYGVEGATKIMEYWQKKVLEDMAKTLKEKGETLPLAEAEKLVNMKAIPKDSIDYLRRAGIINSSANTTDGIYDNFNSGKATADEVISQSGVQTIGSANMPSISVSDFINGDTESFNVSVAGKSYNVYTGGAFENKLAGELNRLATGSESKTPKGAAFGDPNSIVVYNGQIYVYSGYVHPSGYLDEFGWMPVKNNRDYKNLLAAIISNQK